VYLEVASEMVEFEMEDKEVPSLLVEKAGGITHKIQDLRMDHHQLWVQFEERYQKEGWGHVDL
jgi:hypothetical protein